MNTLEKIYLCMKNRSPFIELPPEIMQRARQPLERMLKCRRQLQRSSIAYQLSIHIECLPAHLFQGKVSRIFHSLFGHPVQGAFFQCQGMFNTL